jgi:hypothetical protein
MLRTFSVAVALAAVGAGFGFTGSALAICPIPYASYENGGGGNFGAYAVTSTPTGCILDSQDGGSAVKSASTSYNNGTMSAAADLGSGILTAYSEGGLASASAWDTFTFSGLPATGATITAVLSLSGSSVSGDGTGSAELQIGPPGTIEAGAPTATTFFNATGDPIPASIDLSFSATNGAPETIFAFVSADGDDSADIANLGDPPTLSIVLPIGATASSNSGDFANYQFQSVPEPCSFGLFTALLGLFACLGKGKIILRNHRRAPV